MIDQSTEPPEILYHAIGKENLPEIINSGLVKEDNGYVQLLANRQLALDIYRVQDGLVVIQVLAKDMYDAGYLFYSMDPGIWLTDEIHPYFLRNTGITDGKLTHTRGNIIIDHLNIGDITYEYIFSGCIKSQLITQPFCMGAGEDLYWSWKAKNLLTGEIIEYGQSCLYFNQGLSLYDFEQNQDSPLM